MRIETYTKGDRLPSLIDGSVLHSALLFRCMEKSKGCKPYMLVGYNDNGEEEGHLLFVKRSNIRLLPPVLSVWYSINGEGVYRNKEKREEFFAEFLEKVFEKFDFRHSFIEVTNIEDSLFAYGTLSSHKFIPMRDQRMYISLHSKDPQERLTRAYKAHIRKAETYGVTRRRATNEQEITEAFNLLHRYYISKTRRKLPGKEALHAMLHNDDGTLSDKAKLFIVEYNNKIIGASICLYEKGRASLAYSCGLRKSYPLQYPGIMAIWAAITDADRQGYEHFEFLEVRGLSRLRKSFLGTIGNFGGKDVSTLRWYHFKLGWLNKFLRWIYV